MRIRVNPSRRRIDKVTINLASMIDVSFLLLFYFLVASMLDDRETRLSAGLESQAADRAPSSDLQPQTVEVRREARGPSYRLGARDLRDRAELVAALSALPKGPGLFVKVFDDVPVGFAVAAVQAGRDAGFERVTYVPAR